MIFIISLVILYYNIDNILSNVYLPYILDNDYADNQLISSNKELYFLLNMTSYFMLLLYSYLIIYNLYFSHLYNEVSVGLTFVYIKYLTDIIIITNMSIIEYEFRRNVMWIFSTILMLKMYCRINNLSLKDIGFYYHLFAIISHTLVIPFKYKSNLLYIFSSCVVSIPIIFFFKSLYKYKNLSFTKLCILIWVIFILINILDILRLCDKIIIHAFYNIADTLCKFIFSIIISNHDEYSNYIIGNMDLQCVNFITKINKFISDYENNYKKITPICKELINNYKIKFSNKIQIENNKLKLELLKKILPFDLDTNYIKSDLGLGISKQYTFICVLFMDIVNYTELAKKYNGNIIFKLLDNIYNTFDNIMKKYLHLQKIETIGDAYMVVGDIYRDTLNHKIVVKEIILLSFDFLKEIKNIKTPDDIPLSIRIGINMGPVNIGILGNEVPRLCIVGNTVNVAARLQSTTQPDTIQLSRHVYEQAVEINFGIDFEYIETEYVFLKNIGSVTTYTIKNLFMKKD